MNLQVTHKPLLKGLFGEYCGIVNRHGDQLDVISAVSIKLGIAMEPIPVRWGPNDWLKLIALVGAFALFVLGAWMLYQGIAAEGQVDLKSTILSGTIKATSAGLYICFFALFIIVFVLVTLLGSAKDASHKSVGRAHRLRPIFWGLLVAIGACGLGVAVLPESFRTFSGMAFSVLAFVLASVVFAMIRMTYEDNA